MTYAAYLRIYEPVSAFHEPDRSRWAAYAISPARPRRGDSLAVEHAEALRRAITTTRAAIPERESEHAYVRRADGITYVCPWQTRLRCLLAYGRMLSAAGSAMPGVMPFVPGVAPAGRDDQAAALARLEAAGRRHPSARPHIRGSVWTVPLAWFVPFAATERWVSLGPGRGSAAVVLTSGTSATRAVVYVTPMYRARRRVARGLAALRDLAGGWDGAPGGLSRAVDDLAEVGRWLEDFHPHSLVELDYGGLVHLLSDDALRGDQSVAEIGAAIDGVAWKERELAVAMYMRAHGRWRAFAEFEQAN